MLSHKTEKTFMKYICKQFENPNTKYVDPIHFRGSTKLSEQEIDVILKKLESNGYISYGKFEKQTRPFIKIEPSGIIYFETLRDKRNEFIKENVITPITVSIATSILTTLALQLLPVLQELIQQMKSFLVGS